MPLFCARIDCSGANRLSELGHSSVKSSPSCLFRDAKSSLVYDPPENMRVSLPRETAIGDDRTNPDPPGHDAQRELEQKALRNVRGLVDRIQEEERASGRTQKWVVGVLLVAVAVIAIVMVTSLGRMSGDMKEIVIVPAPKAPAR